MVDNRLKVLLIAYACRPGESSEREVGWKWANIIHARHDVTVLTRETNKPHIDAFIEKNGGKEHFPRFVYYDLPDRIRRFKRGERLLYFYYIIWSFFAILRTRKINANYHFDITHFLTFGTMLWPQFTFLMNTKYVLGPIAGGERIPYSLRHAFVFKNRLKVFLRTFAQKCLYLSPIYWANIVKADRILVRTHETFDFLPRFAQRKSEVFLETAIPDWISKISQRRHPTKIFSIVTVGRLIYWKVNRLSLEAVKEFKSAYRKPFKYLIIGDGPGRPELELAKSELGLNEVEFLGRLPSATVIEHLKNSDVYLSTTTKEGGTWAFFEAIGCMLPVVCLKVNGPDMIIGNGCGIKVKPGQYDDTREVLAKGLLSLANEPKLRVEYAKKAVNYMETNYTWNRVLTRIDKIYRQVMVGKSVSTRRGDRH